MQQTIASDARQASTLSTQQPMESVGCTMAAPASRGTSPRLAVTKKVSSDSLIVSRRVKVGCRSNCATRPTTVVITLLKVTRAMEEASPSACSAPVYCASWRICSAVRFSMPIATPAVRFKPSRAAAVRVTSVFRECSITTPPTEMAVMIVSSARATTRRSRVPHAAAAGRLVKSEGKFSKAASCGWGAANARSRRESRVSSRLA
mmetsp:Transcript_16856/g.53511  ORF Transcript_16856/g.53511 Transcript_16856/m.53511 type:complete len:205 (-) Transcript_16856:528-1142(-)